MSDLISRSELTESIKRQYCTGCDNYNGSRCRACHADDMLSLVDDTADAQRWISVEERLPDVNVDVVLIIPRTDGPCIRVGWLRETGRWWAAGQGIVPYEVTHWMPLPEPPKEE